jgi:glycosyltransferase involved in cell wall biosynthesis
MPLVRTGTGAEVYTRLLAERLRERGHAVTLDVVAQAYQYCPWLAPIAPPPGANVILANSWNAAAFATRGIPTVSVCHLVVHDERLAPFKSWPQAIFHRLFVLPMERAAVRRAAVNVAVSPQVARQMRRILDAERVVTANNGVDTAFYSPGPPRERKAGEPFKLLFVGKPSRRKGYDIVAAIVETLGARVRFTSAGPEPSADLPRPEGNFPGKLDKIALREAYREADLLLFPSRMEGLSLAVAEAMACGLPVLTCEGSSMDEFVPAEGGIVRAQDDIAGFVSEIERVMGDAARHSAMRALSRAFAVENLSEERWVQGIEDALASAVR